MSSFRPPSLPLAAAQLYRMRHVGFTAIELLIVIAIAAILLSLALPSFRGVIARWQLQRATEDMIATIYYARSEAIKRGGQITVQKNPTATGCDASTTQEWSCGWTVLDAATNTVLRTTGIPKGVFVMSNPQGAGVALLAFNRWGQGNNLGIYSFQFTPIAGGTTRTICVASGGRLRTLPDVNSCPSS